MHLKEGLLKRPTPFPSKPQPPAPGRRVQIEHYMVEHRVYSDGTARYVVYNATGARGIDGRGLLAMASSWDDLCHRRGWWIDPEKVAKEEAKLRTISSYPPNPLLPRAGSGKIPGVTIFGKEHTEGFNERIRELMRREYPDETIATDTCTIFCEEEAKEFRRLLDDPPPANEALRALMAAEPETPEEPLPPPPDPAEPKTPEEPLPPPPAPAEPKTPEEPLPPPPAPAEPKTPEEPLPPPPAPAEPEEALPPPPKPRGQLDLFGLD